MQQSSGFRIQVLITPEDALAEQSVFVHRRRMKRLFRTRTLVLILAAFSISVRAEDQPPAKSNAATSGELFETIVRMDRAMFDAFNAHDVERVMTMFTDDLEFYHDTGGLTDYRQTKESFGKLFADRSRYSHGTLHRVRFGAAFPGAVAAPGQRLHLRHQRRYSHSLPCAVALHAVQHDLDHLQVRVKSA